MSAIIQLKIDTMIISPTRERGNAYPREGIKARDQTGYFLAS